MEINSYSDYGSGSSNSEQSLYSPWGSPDSWSPLKSRFEESEPPLRSRSLSFIEGQAKRLDAVMQEFRMNGSDSPYDPEEDSYYRKALTGMGPSSAYLRQKSWPAPDSTPAVGLPPQKWAPSAAEILLSSSRVTEVPIPEPAADEMITEHQMRVLRSLPNAVLYPLLRQLGQSRQHGRTQEELECRFCKNNGERESYYRSHALRVDGRVTCPVLRAFVCRRCGARGDSAHTFKYCPLTPVTERTKSAAMMRSVRASSRRRQAPSTQVEDFVVFGETTPSVIADGSAYNTQALPLDPLWAALEKKLMF